MINLTILICKRARALIKSLRIIRDRRLIYWLSLWGRILLLSMVGWSSHCKINSNNNRVKNKKNKNSNNNKI